MLRASRLAALFIATLCLFPTAHAQVGYAVTSTGQLFYFDVATPATVTTIGTLPFVPEAIDFRPGTSTLYAIDVGPVTTQLYTVSLLNASATPIGAGFPSQVAGTYNLLGATIGFAFNPRTLQADGSVRIRVVASNGSNLRLNSDTGAVAAVDTALAYAAGDPNAAVAPRVDGVAYTNSARSTGAADGTTTLYVMDFGVDRLATQIPPNAGQLNTIGPFGVTVDALSGIGFDIVADPASNDDGIGGDFAYAVFRRPDAPINNFGIYLLYDINLATGQATNGRSVGAGPLDFTGGFAVSWTAIDATPPTVTIDQAPAQADPTTSSPVNFTVVFSEAVIGFAGVQLGGTAGANTAVVTGGPVIYNVAVSGMTSAGTVIATIVAGAAVDAAGNPSLASSSTDNSVTFLVTRVIPTMDDGAIVLLGLLLSMLGAGSLWRSRRRG